MANMADLARLLASLDRRIAALETGERLGRSSFHEGQIRQYHPLTGAPVLRVGTMSDGTFGVEHTNGATPPIPSTPTVTSDGGVDRVHWTAGTREGTPLPLDLARVEVVSNGHVVGLMSLSGGYTTVTLPEPGSFHIRLVTWSGATSLSDPASPPAT